MSVFNNFKSISIASLLVAIPSGVSASLLNADLSSIALNSSIVKTVASLSSTQGQWFTYQVEMEPNNGMPCCLSDNKASICMLDKRVNSWSSNGDRDEDSKTLDIYFKMDGQAPSDLLYAGSECSVDADNRQVYAIDGVTQEQSISFLDGLVASDHTENQSKHVLSKAVGGIAMHSGKNALAMLEKYADDASKKLRHESIFWLGQARNKLGYESLLVIIDDEGRAEKDRTHSVFALSVNSYSGASKTLVDYAKSHPNEKVQSESLFWLAQNHKDKASDVIQHVFENSEKLRVRKKAVFSLAQLKTPESWEQLVATAKSSDDRDIQKEAIFWLSQDEDNNPVSVLLDLIQGENPRPIKDKAVFSLSQLPAEQSTPALLSLIKTSNQKLVKKKALFWLGQSADPRALEYLEQMLTSS